jgi:hypothetical protein
MRAIAIVDQRHMGPDARSDLRSHQIIAPSRRMAKAKTVFNRPIISCFRRVGEAKSLGFAGL